VIKIGAVAMVIDVVVGAANGACSTRGEKKRQSRKIQIIGNFFFMVSYLSDGRVPASHIASTRFQRIETSHKVSFADLSENGFPFVGGTGILGKGASRSKGAAAGGIKWAWDIAFKNDAFALAGGFRIGRRNRERSETV
jgi:hypothetical protein